MTKGAPGKPKAGLLNNKPQDKSEETCEWYINSPQHFNCFWVYVLDKSSPTGSMPELVQSEMANLLGWSNTRTHFILKQAMAELIEALKKHEAHQFIAKDPNNIVDLKTYDLEIPTTYGDKE